ncbi:YecA family protein [Lactococcus petauri]|uniref:YecA family protein n=1 Tax=Lactococcus petauri TaxID=1940789 RepID=UPI0038528C1A
MEESSTKLNEEYLLIKNEIDEKIVNIRTKILQCDPLLLLHQAFVQRNSISILSSITWEKDDDTSFSSIGDAEDLDEIAIQRLPEYIQSVLASSTPLPPSSNIDNESLFQEISSDFYHIMELIFRFYYTWSMNLENLNPNLTFDKKTFLVESQFLYLVRGKRYQIHEIEYLEELLLPHEDIFQSLFKISIGDVTEGIKKLEYSLSQGGIDSFQESIHLFETKDDPKQDKDYISKVVNNTFGVGLKDVANVTHWPRKFIEALSWNIGEDKSFFDNKDFSGWPIIDLPITKRPFIIIDDVSYCFDYYSLLDNFYRAVQKAITRTDKTYNWSDNQQIASENMVEKMFQNILPNCTTFKSNYYYPNNQKDYAENDLLVLYDDTLIIVEVKAGSFVYTAPMLDYDAHVRSYQTLIEKADQQCSRFKKYLTKNSSSLIYDSHKNIKTSINMNNFSKIYTITVTMDNINSVATKAEKMSFLNLEGESISLAIDDLMIYRDYFNSPLKFLHFLKERVLVTKEPKFQFNDEMEHLGLYKNHNCYHLLADKIPENAVTTFNQYRIEIDNYFSQIYHKSLNPIKPEQSIPDLINQILTYLEKNEIRNRSEFANYLLDLSTTAKEEFCTRIYALIERQKELKRELLLKSNERTDGAPGYTCCVHQKSIPLTPYKDRRDSTLASLVWNEEHHRYLIDIFFNEDKIFEKIEFIKFNENSILDDELRDLKKIGENSARRLVQIAKQTNKTVGRNDLCPCGTGKKFKHCCLKRKFI